MLSFGIMKAFYRYVSNSSGQLGSQLHRLIALQFHFPLLSRIPLCWKYPKESLKEDVEGIRTYNLAFCSSFNNCTFSGVVAVTSFYRRVVMYELYMDLLAFPWNINCCHRLLKNSIFILVWFCHPSSGFAILILE